MGHSLFFFLVMAPANCIVKDTMVLITLTRKWMYDFYMNCTYETLCAISYHLFHLKNVKNTHREVLLLEKLQASLQLC